MRDQLGRFAIGLTGFLMLLLAIAFFVQAPFLGDVWPWTTYSSQLSPLSFTFLSSIAAAIAAPLLWIGATGNIQAAPAGALNLMVAFGGIAVFMFQSAQDNVLNSRLQPTSVAIGGSALANLLVYVVTRTLPSRDPLPLPKPIRISFGIFVVALILVGGALVLKKPNILPWDLTVEASVVYGWIFLGAAVYFAYALAKPLWENAAGPLLGFLAYDVVLIIPFLRHFADVPDAQRLSLTIYTGIVSYSGVLATYYLFVDRETRLMRRQRRNPIQQVEEESNS